MAVQHTVKSGETLSGIGSQYGLSYQESVAGITGYRSGNVHLIYPGEVLTVPDGGQQPAPPTSQTQVTPYLNQFQSTLYGAQQTPQVRTPDLGEVKAAIAPSTAAPAPIDYAKLRETQREQFGVAVLEEEFNTLKAAIEQTEATKRIRAKAEEGKPVALGVIAGRVGEIERQENEQLDFLGRQAQRVADDLNTKYALINQIMQDTRLTYTDAASQYDREFSRNMQMYELVLGQEMRALDQAQRARAEAKSNLQIYANAVAGGNINYASLPTDQKLMISKLEAQSGLPIGFIGSLQMNVQDKLINVNDKTGEALLMDASGNFKVVQTGLRTTPASIGGTEEKRGAFAEAESWLSEKGGQDQFVSGEEWKYIRSIWAQQGYDISEFDDAFKARFVGDPTTRQHTFGEFGFEDDDISAILG